MRQPIDGINVFTIFVAEMYQRIIETDIIRNIGKQKVSIILGARRVGKTALMQSIASQCSNVLWLNGEDQDAQDLLERRSKSQYQKLLRGVKLLIIDEAQYIPEISLKLKLMIDTIKPLHIIISGSSAFDMGNMGEPLAGRTLTYHLHSFSQEEWSQKESLFETKQHLEDRLIYGSYPEISQLETPEEKVSYLKELVNTYLLKDILVFEKINNSQKLRDLLKLIALQMGAEVSLEELGKQLGLSKNTISRYLDILSKSFVVFSLSGYSNNLRKEIVKNKKWYFADAGVRNALINDFTSLHKRKDIGSLWEQYIITERLKYIKNHKINHELHFWRTYDHQEIDLIETGNDTLIGYEIKWKKQRYKIPGALSKNYPEASIHLVHQENYLDFIFP